MNIAVRFEIQSKFNRRIAKLEDAFEFKSFMQELEKINSSNSDNNTENQIAVSIVDEFKNRNYCLINSTDLSGYRSFVLENINYYINILKKLNVENVLINNPPRILVSQIKKLDNVHFFRSSPFKKINICRINKMRELLDTEIVGQINAKSIIYRKMIVQHIRKSDKPLVLMFYGNPGIGKTETAKLIGKALYGSNKIIREQMSMSMGDTSVRYFKSADHSENSFSKSLLNRESNVILLDEFALAPEYIQTSFFQLFDEGKFVDQNFDVDMRNSVIICTSNYTNIKEMENSLGSALLSRFDAKIRFDDFSEDEKIQIATRMIDEWINKNYISEKFSNKLDVDLLKKTVNEVVNKSVNFRTIKSLIEDVIAQQLIDQEIFNE